MKVISLSIIPVFFLTVSCTFWGLTNSRIVSSLEIEAGSSIVLGDQLCSLSEEVGQISYQSIAVDDVHLYKLSSDGETLSIMNKDSYTAVSQTYNLNTWNDPGELNEYPPPVLKYGDYLYCGDFNILDVSDPDSITRVFSTDILPIHDMKNEGTTLFIVNSSGLIILDCSDPYNPVVRSRLADLSGGKRTIEIQGNTAYISDWAGELLGIIDIKDIDNPQLSSVEKKKFPDQSILDMELYGDSLFISTSEIALGFLLISEYSIKDPLELKKNYNFSQPSLAAKIIIDNGKFYLCSSSDILILEY